MQRFAIIILLIASVVCASDDARAGRRAFLWTFASETVPEGTLELEQWLWARAFNPNSGDTTGWIWFAPVYGLHDHIEIAVPWEMVVNEQGARITNFSLDARFTFLDRLEEHLFRPLLRVVYQQNFDHPDNFGRWMTPWMQINAVGTLGDVEGTHLSIDLGFYTDLRFGRPQVMGQTAGVGFTWNVWDGLRLGAEYFHDLGMGHLNSNKYKIHLGPVISYSRHRFWTTLGALVNVLDQGPRLTPRLIVGVAL